MYYRWFLCPRCTWWLDGQFSSCTQYTNGRTGPWHQKMNSRKQRLWTSTSRGSLVSWIWGSFWKREISETTDDLNELVRRSSKPLLKTARCVEEFRRIGEIRRKPGLVCQERRVPKHPENHGVLWRNTTLAVSSKMLWKRFRIWIWLFVKLEKLNTSTKVGICTYVDMLSVAVAEKFFDLCSRHDRCWMLSNQRTKIERTRCRFPLGDFSHLSTFEDWILDPVLEFFFPKKRRTIENCQWQFRRTFLKNTKNERNW
jgi:hypothetical protein